MARIVSVWLPRWPVLRFLAAQARNSTPARQVDPELPFVLTAGAANKLHIAALNPAAPGGTPSPVR